MRTERNRHPSSQIVIGAIAIAIGIIFLLDNLDLLDAQRVLHLWPLLLVVLGTAKVLRNDTPNATLWGGILIVVGVLMTLSRLGFHFFSMHFLWPLLLIVLGLSVVTKAFSSRRGVDAKVSLDKPGDAGVSPGNDASIDSYIDAKAIMGGFQRRISSTDFRGGEITAVMGGCELDLRGSTIQGEAVLDVVAICGGISIKVPTDWTVIMQGTPILGGFEEKTIAPPDASKRLVIKGYAIMGGMEVRN